MSQYAVGITTDINYYKHAKVLIKSILCHNSNIDISYKCVGFTPDIEFHKSVKTYIDMTPLSKKKTFLMKGVDIMHPRMSSLRNRMCSEQMVYTVHDKYWHLLYLLQQGYEKIIITDADCIVRGDLTEIFENLDGNDLSMQFHRGSTPYIGNKVVLSEGFIVCRNNKTVELFFKRVTEELVKAKKENRYDIDTDTEVIVLLHEQGIIKVKDLPIKYKDSKNLYNTSIVWSGQGATKSAPLYINEALKYEN